MSEPQPVESRESRRAKALREPSRIFRGPIARGLAVTDAETETAIDPEGGEYGAGLIRGAAVVTRGEAFGHNMWIDAVMLKQVHDATNLTANGTKSRFTHPSLTGDGLGRALGRYRNAVLDGNIVRADLHMFSSAHKTPDGDLAGYVLALAKEDPTAFGNSIRWWQDDDAEVAFVAKHEDDDGKFQSPDDENTNNMPHGRLYELEGIDAVDEPAANPSGLYHKGDEIAFEADQILAYALGIEQEVPTINGFSIAPERLRGFVARFLEQRGLSIISKKSLTSAQTCDILRRQCDRYKEHCDRMRACL